MKDYKITFLQSALDDLQEIILYISVDSKQNALIWHDKLMNTVNKLSSFPMLGILIPDKKISQMGFRMLPIGNYLLFYKIYEEDKEVSILRVLHGNRDYPSLFENYIYKEDK